MKSSGETSTIDTPWSIGEVAARFGLATHVLRHWEDVGLLAPERDTAGRRRFGDAEVTRVAVILRSKAAGMSLEQIDALLDGEAPQRHAVLEAHLADLDRRMVEMERAKKMARHAFECEQHDVANCPRFRSFVADIVDGTAVTPGVWGDSGAHAHSHPHAD